MKLLLLLVVAMLAGCAGTHTISSTEEGQQDGRIVESLVLTDSSVVWFDPWDSAGPGRDKRARIQGEAVVGYVDGAYSSYLLADVLELRFGGDDSTRTKTVLLVVVPLVLGAALVAIFFATFDLQLN